MAPTDSDELLARSGRVLLRRPEVLRRVGLKSPVTLWRWVETGDFPAPVKLNPDGTLCAWREDEVDAWVASRQRGKGKRPEAALEAHERYARERHDAAREAANIQQGRTPKFGFKRGT